MQLRMNTNQQAIKIMHWNANGIRGRIGDFFSYLSRNNILIACVNETKLNDQIRFKHPNYRVFRLDSTEGSVSSGGIAIVLHRSLTCKLLPWFDTKLVQCFGVNVTIVGSSFDLNIVSAYLTGTARLHNYSDYRHDLIKISQLRNFILVGDLNSRHPYWGCFSSNRAGRVLYDLLNENRFEIYFPDSPTFYRSNTRNPSTIDIVLKNSNVPIQSIEVSYELHSDHLPIILELGVPLPDRILTCLEPIPCFRKANWSRFRAIFDRLVDLKYFTLEGDFNSADIDERISHLTDLIVEATDRCVPLCIPKLNRLAVPPHLLAMIYERRRLRRQFIRNGRPPIIADRISILSSLIDKDFQQLHNTQFQREIAKIIPGEDHNRKLFKLAKNLRGPRTKLGSLKDDSRVYISNMEKADVFASVFVNNHLTSHSNVPSSTFEEEVKRQADQIRSLSIRNVDPSILFKPSEVKSVLKNLKNGKAPGADRIRNESLKYGSRKLLVAITMIFNACIQLSYFPKTWRNAVGCPVPKPNKPSSCPKSYRLISLLSTLSKVFERLILDRLKIPLNDEIPDFQFGFKLSHSTCHQVQRVVNCVREGFSNGFSTGMVLLDLKAAFDSVWHDGLIYKLSNTNCPLYLIRLIQSFLSDRSFSVKVEGERSAMMGIPAGVPQGAVLSPFLFNLFMSDLPTSVDCLTAQFADDIGILCSALYPTTIIACLQSYVDDISNFCNKWRLRLNPEKTESVFFTRRTSERFLPEHGINVLGHDCPWLPAAKYLGVFLDKRLTFARHVDHALNKTGKVTRALYSVLNRRSRLFIKNKLLIFKTILRPVYTYGCQVWGGCADTHLKKLQVAQNKILKMCYNLPYDYSTRLLHQRDKIDLVKIYANKLKTKFVDRCRLSDSSLVRNLF